MASRLGIIRTLTQESWFNLIWCINALKCCIFFWNLCVTNWAWPNQGQSHKLPLIPEIKRNLFWIFQLLLAKSSLSLKANFWIKGFGFIKNKSISIDSINLYLYSKSPHKKKLWNLSEDDELGLILGFSTENIILWCTQEEILSSFDVIYASYKVNTVFTLGDCFQSFDRYNLTLLNFEKQCKFSVKDIIKISLSVIYWSLKVLYQYQ